MGLRIDKVSAKLPKLADFSFFAKKTMAKLSDRYQKLVRGELKCRLIFSEPASNKGFLRWLIRTVKLSTKYFKNLYLCPEIVHSPRATILNYLLHIDDKR